MASSFTTKTDLVNIYSAGDINAVQDAIQTGWMPASETLTYASATTFTVSGDVTAKYFTGVKLKLTQTSVKYFYVVSSSYSAPNTTVTVTGESSYTLASAAITVPYLSYGANPQGFPQWFNYAPNWGGLTAGDGTVAAKFQIAGRLVTVAASITLGASSSVSGDVSLSMPIASTLTISAVIGVATLTDAGNAVFEGIAYLSPPSSLLVRYASVTGSNITQGALSATAPFTWTTTDVIAIVVSYPI